MLIESGGASAGVEANTAPTAEGWSSPPAPYASQKKGNTRLTLLYRIATGGDARTTNDTGDHQVARIIAVKAGTFDGLAPFNTAAVGTQAATKAVSIPGAGTTRDNCLVVACASGNLPDATGTAEFSGVANAALAGLTERVDNTVTAGDGGALFAATGVKAAQGAYGATTVTAATEAERAVISVAINPVVPRQLVYTLSAGSGSARGLKRIRVTNEGVGETSKWYSLIWAEECWDAPEDLADPTAALVYEAKDLTPQGGAGVATVDGVRVVQHSGLTSEWKTILDSKIAGVGHMTHRGPRQMWMRINESNPTSCVQLCLQYLVLGGTRWVDTNPIIGTYNLGWSLVDLGTCRPQEALIGEDRWQWRLRARSSTGAGSIAIRDAYPLPTEQYLRVSETLHTEEDAICLGSRSIELASNGVFREGYEGGVWGRLVPDGFYPYAPAGGLEGRPARGIVIASCGDNRAFADSGTPVFSLNDWTRDGYLFAREAA
jgi:hypothetical protein